MISLSMSHGRAQRLKPACTRVDYVEAMTFT